MNGAYWGLTALDILGKLDIVDADEVISWVMSCQHQSGKFSKKKKKKKRTKEKPS